MPDENLSRIADGVKDFINAVNARIDRDAVLLEKIQEALTYEERDALQMKAVEISRLTLENLDKGETSDEFQKAYVEFQEIYFGILLRVISQRELVRDLPASLKGQEVADVLRSCGANSIADLCVFTDEASPETPVKRLPTKPRRFDI